MPAPPVVPQRPPGPPLPPLRQDLSLHAGPADTDGAPTWTLHDPAANRFYRLAWPAFEILARWSLGDPQAVLAQVAAQTTLRPDAQDLADLLDFLGAHHLLDAGMAEDTRRLAQAARALKPSWSRWLLHNYLFVRVPLLRPRALLERLGPAVAWVFRPGFWVAIAATALLGLVLAAREWDHFVHTFSGYAGFAGLAGIGAALSLAKLLHEMGHALAAQRYGCRVPTMGVAFLVLVPVLYTDTNEAWKLPDKRQRLAIAAAGMLSELALAAVATLAWSLLPDGPVRAGVFMLATTTWIVTLGLNASPFMRFDGYFLLSDWLDTPNLHGRAFALGRWWLRRTLFGWDEPPPERFAPGRQAFLVAFAVATAVYRLVVFLGIAFLVYRISFKLLGLLLLAVELGWFIALPVAGELKVWWARRAELRWNGASLCSAGLVAVLLAFALLPWRTGVRAAAILGAADAQGLYAVAGAQVASPVVAVGTAVGAGQLLLRLESPELRARLAGEQVHERLFRWELEQQPFDPELRKQGEAVRQRWMAAAAAVRGLQEQIEQLSVRAPFAGRVVQVDEGLAPGVWVAQKDKLVELVGARGAKADAFVDERDLPHVQVGAAASFVADGDGLRSLACRVERVDTVNIATLDELALASTYGGAIAVQKDAHGALVPTTAWYRVQLGRCGAGAAAPTRELRGVARLEGARSSLAGDALRAAIAVVQREMGF